MLKNDGYLTYFVFLPPFFPFFFMIFTVMFLPYFQLILSPQAFFISVSSISKCLATLVLVNQAFYEKLK